MERSVLFYRVNGHTTLLQFCFVCFVFVKSLGLGGRAWAGRKGSRLLDSVAVVVNQPFVV